MTTIRHIPHRIYQFTLSAIAVDWYMKVVNCSPKEGFGLTARKKGLLVPTWSFCILFLSVFNCRLMGVGWCRLYLSVVVGCCWLSGVGCQVLTVDFRVSLLVVVVGSWLSGVISGVFC